MVEQVNSRLVALEGGPRRTPVRFDEEGRAVGSVPLAVVTQSEFRLFKWFGAFALATVIGGFGFLYQQSDRQFDDIRMEMKNLRTEMRSEFTSVRAEFASVRAEIADVRADLADLSERVVRVETLLGEEGAGSKNRS